MDHHEETWNIEKKMHCIRIVKLFYEGIQCAVEDQREVGEWLNIKTGVKQGCNMSGFIFLIGTD